MKLHVFLRRNLRVVQFYPALRPLLGSASAVLFFGQALYWSDKTDNDSGWFWKTEEQWEEETSLSRREQETARRLLRQAGVLLEEFRGIPRKLWFRLDLERFEQLAETYFSDEKPNNNDIMRESAIIAWRNPPLLPGGIRQASMADSAITTPRKRSAGAASRPPRLQHKTTAENKAAGSVAAVSAAPSLLHPEIHQAISSLPPSILGNAQQVCEEEQAEPAIVLSALQLLKARLESGKIDNPGAFLRAAIQRQYSLPQDSSGQQQQALRQAEDEAWRWWQGLGEVEQKRQELGHHSRLLGVRGLTDRRKALILFRLRDELQEAA